VEACCKRYISQLLNLALRAAKKYDERDAAKWLREIVKYAVFVEGAVEADGNIYSEADKLRLIEFYHGDADAGDDREENAKKLKSLIFLTEAYVAPLSGIDGLLGKVQNLNDLMLADPSANKKRWAWG